MEQTSTIECPSCDSLMSLTTVRESKGAPEKMFVCQRSPNCSGMIPFPPDFNSRNYQSIAEATADALDLKTQNATNNSTPEIKSETSLTENEFKVLSKLRDRLSEISARNRSIRLSRLNKKWAFDLSSLNPLGVELGNKILQHCLDSSKPIEILPKGKTTQEKELLKTLNSRLVALNRAVKEIYKEKGLYDLYIGFPFLAGIPSKSGTVIQGPVFLLPVKLEKTIDKKQEVKWTLHSNNELPVTFNKSLLMALEKLGHFKMNDAIFEEEIPEELYGKVSFVQKTHELLDKYGITCEIAPNALDQELDPVREFLRTKQNELFNDGKLELLQHAVLGHFPQSDSSIQRDYEELLKLGREKLESITCFLRPETIAEDNREFQTDALGVDPEVDALETPQTIDDRPEKENWFVLPTDSSQERILLELNHPKNQGLVVWGPPGTGKSQTIVNIISDCLSRNKTVLLVSQKRAALDVVYDRLKGKHLSGLIGKVHDSKSDRKELFSKIANRVDQVDSMVSQLENISDPSEEIDRVGKTLGEVTLAYNDSSHEVTLGELYRKLGSHKELGFKLNIDPWKNSKQSELHRLENVLTTTQSLFEKALCSPFFENRPNYSNISDEQHDSLIALLSELTHSNRLEKAHYVILQEASNLTQKYFGELSPEITSEYDELQEKVDSFGSFTKFFAKGYWTAKRELNELKNSSKKYYLEKTEAVSRLVPTFLGPEISGFIISNVKNGNLQKGKTLELYCVLQEAFSSIRVFDQEVTRLSPELQKCVQSLVDAERHGLIKSEDRWGRVFVEVIQTEWVRELEKKHPILSNIRTNKIDSLRSRYRELLAQKMDYAVQELKRKYQPINALPETEKFKKVISSDVKKVRKILSIRKLNENYLANPTFRQLIPVWFASPETVSSIFPLQKGLFDVVIFDEASQCPVEHALPSVFRGKQVIIAGDEKQLPPSNMFESTCEEFEENEEATEDSAEISFAIEEESLLTLAKKVLRYKSHMLRWHYRSKYEELIQYSNQVFYDGKIQIAPNVIPFRDENLPAITWHGVDGYWKEKSNEAEAQKIIERVKEHLAQDPQPTIGVITFNLYQKELILDLIEKHRIEDPVFNAIYLKDRERKIDSQLFVKNIENVQGDEREVILFSVAYAKSQPNGRVNQLFGSLNTKGGENRLNVAVTRAIKHIEVVASIDPETDLDVSLCKSTGPRILKNYLRFAKSVAERDYGRRDALLAEINANIQVRKNGAANVHESPFEAEVREAIEELGFTVDSQVGQSGYRIDLAVIHPDNKNRYLLAVECDGAQFHSGVSVRERDVFRQNFLEARGWKVHRVWSTNWWKNKNKEVTKIRAAIDEALRGR